jgi:hypothetical protein
MRNNVVSMRTMTAAIVLGFMIIAMPAIGDSGLPNGYAKIKDWDQVYEAFSFATGGAATSGGDFFIAPRGIHVFDSPGIIDMGMIDLDGIEEAPASGYMEMVMPIDGHSYVVRSNGKYGKFYIDETYDWLDPIEYGIHWIYQPNGSRALGSIGVSDEPSTQEETDTYGEIGSLPDSRDAYQQYIAAYNKLTSLAAQGKGDTPEAQAAYEEYVAAKSRYESMTSGTKTPQIASIGECCSEMSNPAQSGLDRPHLTEVWGSSGSDVFAVGCYVSGEAGTIIHYNGSKWTWMLNPTRNDLHSVWGSAGNDVFAVGNSGIILHYDGGSWIEMASPTPNNLRDVWGSAWNDVFAVGNSGTIIHFDGSSWTEMSYNPRAPANFYGVWGSAWNDVFAVGDGIIFHYDGSNWTEMPGFAGIAFRDVWGTAGNDIFAVGVLPIFHYDGSSWKQMNSPVAEMMSGVWGSAGNDVFVVGNKGNILHYDGSKWIWMCKASQNNLQGVWGTAWNDVFVVGDAGTILHCSAGTSPTLGTKPITTPTPSPTQQLKISDLRGTLNTDDNCNLYVADYGQNQVKMIGPNGSATTYVSGIDRPRYQVFDSVGNLYVGSFDGNIYKVSATGVKTVIASGIWSPQDMGFDGAGNLYVAGGYDGKIHRIAPDGTKTIMDSGFAHPKHLAVYPDGNVYVVDSDGSLIVRITPEGGKASLADLGETILGMVTDGEYLYVSHSDKVSRIDAYGQATHIATGLDQPSSLAICNGNIFVTVRDGIVKTMIGAAFASCDWTGAWDTNWGNMDLLQIGNNVNGIYDHDQGLIQGTVLGRKLTGTWSEYPSYAPPDDAGDIEFIISEDCNSFNGSWRYGTTGEWAGTWTGSRISIGSGTPAANGSSNVSGTQVGTGTSNGSGTSYPEATLNHSGFDFTQGNTGEFPTYDGEVISWQPGAAPHPDYPRDSDYVWWRNTHLDDLNFQSQTKDMGAVDISTVRTVPAEWDLSPLIPPLLVGHTIVARCYDGYVKFQVISVDPIEESALVKYSFSTDTTFDDATG